MYATEKNLRRAVGLATIAVLGASLALTGCSAALPPAGGLPFPPAPGSVNSYVGKVMTPLPSVGDVRLWKVKVDRDHHSFSYSADGDTASTTGAFSDLNGFLLLLDQKDYQMGYGLEIPGRVAILRPGDNTVAPIFSVQQPNCFPIAPDPITRQPSNIKFHFVQVPGGQGNGTAAFGSLYATTSADGRAWMFNGFTLYQRPDGSLPSNAFVPPYPGSFSGTCSVADGAASINITTTEAYTVPTRLFIHPAGYFLEDQEFPNGNVASIGIAAPSAPVNTKAIAANTYRGFLFTPTTDRKYLTQPVGFGGGESSASTIVGGTYANDDPTQATNGAMAIALGAQDPQNNGLFYAAKLTMPLASGSCSTPNAAGTDVNGNPTCTYSAVALVGNQEDRCVLLLSMFDGSFQKLLVLFQRL